MNHILFALIILITQFLAMAPKVDARPIDTMQATVKKIMSRCASQSDDSGIWKYDAADLRPRKILYSINKKAKNFGQGQCSNKRRISSSETLTSKRFWRRISGDNQTGRCLEFHLTSADWNRLHQLLSDDKIRSAYSSEPNLSNGRLSDSCSYFDYKFYLKSGILLQFSFDYSFLPSKEL